ncbi:outer membrane protein OmpA-like peptidoglycan-associated protein [Pedobacter sp. UYP30]|uniref:OmpA family protein n=1 Tax=Pedobacter sp. UYP30 TaxID=1756400 RepID=UPI003395A17F
MKRLLYLCFLMVCANCFGQKSEDRKAQNLFDKASSAAQQQDFGQTINLLEEAVNTDAKFTAAYVFLGDVYMMTKKYPKAEERYKTSLTLDKGASSVIFYKLAESEFANGKYIEAKSNFEKFIGSKPRAEDLEKAQKYLLNCNFAAIAIKNPVKYTPLNLGEGVNTKNAEYFPAITADGETLIFTRQVDENEDFWTSKFLNNAWAKAIPLSAKINTPEYNEGAQTISPDGKYLFFTGCNRPDGLGKCDIYVAHREGAGWGEPYNVGRPVNSEYWESQPAISPDGRTLYFISNRPGGFGGYDIWKSTITADSKWGAAINLGPKINTPYDENTPYLHVDGKTFYFSSDGWPGFGHKDIFYSRLDSAGNWQTPINMGYPINSFEDETGLVVGADGSKGYFSSTLPSGYGKQDIYRFDIPESAKPKKVVYVKGTVRDLDSKQTIESSVEIIDLQTNKTVFDDYTDAQNGEFLAVMPIGSNYLFNVSADGYLFYSENFQLTKANLIAPYKLTVDLEKIKAGAKVTLKNIFFDTNKYDLLPTSIKELEKLTDFLNENKTVAIEIQGYTDNVGDVKLNETLSQNRAMAVYNYLIHQDIDAKRLTAKGFGESKPIADNTTETGRQKNRRTSFLITKT